MKTGFALIALVAALVAAAPCIALAAPSSGPCQGPAARPNPQSRDCGTGRSRSGMPMMRDGLGPMMGFDRVGYRYDDDDDHMDWDGGWWIVMGIGMVLFWGLVIFGIVWLVRELGHRRDSEKPGGEPDAMAILDRRLALGEISPEEYRERRETLRGGPD